ncbi:MAG: MBL fold metallo-hydrolase [Gemmatimonadaceae bacterium]|nr:MBL fold metallo-hydrolase [Gemmatimonadaceae bacterium]
MTIPSISRRDALRVGASCAAHLALASFVMPRPARAAWAHRPIGRVVARAPFGTLERVADGVWALISDPFGGDRTTLSNGGLIAGKAGVVAIEGFNTPAGASWLAQQSLALTGRWPTHVVLTHYHADHANGVAGYRTDGHAVSTRATEVTRDQVLTRNAADADRRAALSDAVLLRPEATDAIDLGDRRVRCVARRGHTASDVTVELDDPSVVFCGDLVWNGLVPNYVDAIPSALRHSVRALMVPGRRAFVPGHGAMADRAALVRYAALLDAIEAGARAARDAGTPPEEAGARFTLPESLDKWTLFSPTYFTRAFSAWNREWDAPSTRNRSP